MKIKLFLIITMVSISCFADNYKKTREDLKLALYEKQKVFMKLEQYYIFIEPHLQKIEDSLYLTKYFAKNPDSEFCKQYFKHLLNYNVEHFYSYVKPDSGNAFHNYILIGNQLRNYINETKDKAQLQDLDVQKEFQLTSKLLNEANVAYYKQLNPFSKFALLFGEPRKIILNPRPISKP